MAEVTTMWGTFAYPKGDHIGEVMKGGHYEATLIHRIIDRAPLNRVAVDIGANIGTHTVPYSGVFKETHAFEPHPVAFEYLQKNAPNAHLYNVGLSSFAGEAFINIAKEGESQSNLGSTKVRVKGNTPITLATLDSFQIGDVGLIKIDVEGHEGRVVQGAIDTITEYRPIIVVEQIVPDKHFDVFGFLLCDLRYSKVERVSRNYIVYP